MLTRYTIDPGRNKYMIDSIPTTPKKRRKLNENGLCAFNTRLVKRTG